MLDPRPEHFLKSLCKRSKKIDVEDRIQKTNGEDEETVLDFPAQYEVYGCLKKWWWSGGFGRRICKIGKGAQAENLLFDWFFCASVDVGRFLYQLNNTLQA